MTATTDTTTATGRLPPRRLTARQQVGLDCAVCRAFVGPRGVPLGVVRDDRGFLYLYGCARCAR